MNEELTDEQIVVKTISEDKEYFAMIIDRYEEKLLRYANYLIKDEYKAVDVVQESFIKAYSNLNGFTPTKKFSSWIYRIVHNQSMNIIKKYLKETPIPENFDLKSDENIEEEFEKKEIINMVKLCLNQIPLIYSEPLTLFYIDGKSYEEISDILQIPMGTVATRISRAKLLMKKLCQQN